MEQIEMEADGGPHDILMSVSFYESVSNYNS